MPVQVLFSGYGGHHGKGGGQESPEGPAWSGLGFLQSLQWVLCRVRLLHSPRCAGLGLLEACLGRGLHQAFP